jgi:hypothetical protein
MNTNIFNFFEEKLKNDSIRQRQISAIESEHRIRHPAAT